MVSNMGDRKLTEATIQKVLLVAKFIIQNKATIGKTAENFEMSTSSIKKYINDLLPQIDEEIYRTVKETQKEIEYLGQIQGGYIGKRGPKYGEEEALKYAKDLISQDLTLDQVSDKFKVARSTIYERVKDINNKELQDELTEAFRGRKGGR